jgi:hypothetical protein
MKEVVDTKGNKPEEFGSLLSEMRTYFRIIAGCMMAPRAKAVINSYEKALTYANLGTTGSDKELAKVVGSPRRTVTSWIDEFVKYGLAEKHGHTEKALFTLEELDIRLGDLKRSSTQRKPKVKAAKNQENIESKKQQDDRKKKE